MAKTKLIIPVLLVILIVSLAFNAYQFSNSFTVKPQSNSEEMPLLLIDAAKSTMNCNLTPPVGSMQKLTSTGLTKSS